MRWALGGFVQIDERLAQVAGNSGKTERKIQGKFVPNLLRFGKSPHTLSH
jgi:hypothetical protein